MAILVTEAQAEPESSKQPTARPGDIDLHHKDVPAFIARFVDAAWLVNNSVFVSGQPKQGMTGALDYARRLAETALSSK